MIAQDVTRQQIEVCEAKRARIDDQLKALTSTGEANARTVGSLSEAVARLTVTVTSLAGTVAAHSAAIADHETRLAVLGVRLAVSAAVGGSLPVIVVLAWQWFSNR
jgi:uncharacterized protein YigA (DUF484 family)